MNCSNEIDAFKIDMNLHPAYELHHRDNPKWLRKSFRGLISKLDFNFMIIAVRKNKTLYSYTEFSKILVGQIKDYPTIKIRMDKNPKLFKAIKNESKNTNTRVDIKQVESRGNNLIQLADYVAAMVYQSLKKNGSLNNLPLRDKCNNIVIIK